MLWVVCVHEHAYMGIAYGVGTNAITLPAPQVCEPGQDVLQAVAKRALGCVVGGASGTVYCIDPPGPEAKR